MNKLILTKSAALTLNSAVLTFNGSAKETGSGAENKYR